MVKDIGRRELAVCVIEIQNGIVGTDREGYKRPLVRCRYQPGQKIERIGVPIPGVTQIVSPAVTKAALVNAASPRKHQRTRPCLNHRRGINPGSDGQGIRVQVQRRRHCPVHVAGRIRQRCSSAGKSPHGRVVRFEPWEIGGLRTRYSVESILCQWTVGRVEAAHEVVSRSIARGRISSLVEPPIGNRIVCGNLFGITAGRIAHQCQRRHTTGHNSAGIRHYH